MLPDLWGLATIATKFALYFGVLTATGTVFAALLFRLTTNRGFVLRFAAVGMAAALLGFALAGAALTGDASGMTDPEMLGLLWSTSVGTTLALRLTGLILLITGLFVGRAGVILSLIGGVLALWSFVNIGHIPDRGSLVLNLVLMFHLVAISVWIGILSPLRAMSRDAVRLPDAADLGHRFGRFATMFVPLLLLAGGYMSYALVGSLSALLTESYGQALVLKIMLVAGLLALAAVNKLRFIPQMRNADPVAARRLVRSISIEWMVIVAVLLTTAVLTSVLILPS